MATYQEMLLDPLWKNKRDIIVNRDRYTCLLCQNKTVIENCICSIGNLIKSHQINGWYMNKYIVYQFRNNTLESRLFILRSSSTDNQYILVYHTGFPHIPYITNQKAVSTISAEGVLSLFMRGDAGYVVDDTLEHEHAFLKIEKIRPNKRAQWLKNNTLHVHHTYYQENRLPWDYPDESLQTLCSECHFKHHKNNSIIYLSADGKQQKIELCTRCQGAGVFPEFNHVQSGVCFKCGGSRYFLVQ